VLERFGNRLDGDATDSRSTRGEWERKIRVDINPVLGSKRPGETGRAGRSATTAVKAAMRSTRAAASFELPLETLPRPMQAHHGVVGTDAEHVHRLGKQGEAGVVRTR
jgi:hypothetical protein